MGEIVSENMTKNANAKVLSKEEIMAALNERHSPEKQKHLSARKGCDSRTWRIGIKCGICTCQNRSRTSPSDRF